jgi:hypothetical protein
MKQLKAPIDEVTSSRSKCRASLKQVKLDDWWQDRLDESMKKHFEDIIGEWQLISSWKVDGWNDGTSTLHGVYEKGGIFKLCAFPDYLAPTCELVQPVFAHVAWEPVK